VAVEPAKVYHDKLRGCRASWVAAAVSKVTSSITNGSGRGAIFYESAKPALSGLKGTLEHNKEGGEWTRTDMKSNTLDQITRDDRCCQQSAPDRNDNCAIAGSEGEYELRTT